MQRTPAQAGEAEASGFSAHVVRRSEREAALELAGILRLSHAAALWRSLGQILGERVGEARFDFDLGKADAVDGAAMSLLVAARADLMRRGVACDIVGASPSVQKLVQLYGGEERLGAPVKRRKAPGFFEQVGRNTLQFGHHAKQAFAFIGQLVTDLRCVVFAPSRGNFREVPSIVERTGADAVPIVLLINFLVGLVMAFQASVQLKRFGASILVADLIGISMTRELGPLMTAIVVCGRSGAAFAAELGTMKVNEEIDALRVLGLSPARYLVLPRVLGLMLVVPLLSLFADAVGVLGGLTVGVTRLDLTWTSYMRQTMQAVKLWDVYSGVIKAFIFAAAIGLIACQQGLAASGGAEGVGKRTTSAVVSSLFVLILIDAIFTVMFRLTGL